MRMTSRQIIRSVLKFENPSRIGMSLPEPYPNDFVFAERKVDGYEDARLAPQGNEFCRWRDEWGVLWASLTDYDKGEVVEAAIADWSQLDDYSPPDLGQKQDYAHAVEVFAADREHFRVGYLPGFPFNVARKLRKLDNYLCDLVLHRENVNCLNAMVRTELLKAIDRLAEAGADAIMFAEDWGTQESLMISPEMWREIFKPEFETLCGRAHERGLFVLMHSCGKITAIINDLIECGVDCLQFDQPRLHGIETLAENFAGRMTFWCPVDIQTTLQTKDPELIRREAQLLVEKLGGRGGGFIAGYYSGNQAIGLSPDVQDHACKAFVACRMCRR
ncbi:MAG: uroporphyrinogen decarboxylase family protein [Planctomycetota bacterium]|nr:uroporphyrinogen decarboxylase family protein [Planctomycetota bacterium]